MGYTPKHAKPASLDSTLRDSRHGLFAVSVEGRGRHAATGAVTPATVVSADSGTAAPEQSATPRRAHRSRRQPGLTARAARAARAA